MIPLELIFSSPALSLLARFPEFSRKIFFFSFPFFFLLVGTGGLIFPVLLDSGPTSFFFVFERFS